MNYVLKKDFNEEIVENGVVGYFPELSNNFEYGIFDIKAGVFDANNRFISYSAHLCGKENGGSDRVAALDEFIPMPTKFVDKKVIYGGGFLKTLWSLFM